MGPLTQDEFAELMAVLEPALSPGRIVLACSGGPDSMALAVFLRNWCLTQRRPLTALIVDHGLRAESAEEAATVCEWLDQLGISAEILTRKGQVSIDRDIQNQARELRYSLLLDWCREHAARELFLAHHLDDQAETVMIRLARGSGVDGLAAMRACEERGAVRLRRPLLPVPKARLSEMLAEAGIAFVQDPSNDKEIFTRVRWRRLMPQLAAEELTAERLAATAGHMRRAGDALDRQVARHLDRSGRLFADGSCRLILRTLLDAEREIVLRALSRLVQGVVAAPYPPRFEAVARLLDGLQAAALRDDQDLDSTLAGARMSLRRGALWMGREMAAIQDVITLDEAGSYLWDGRFEIVVDKAVAGAWIGPIGAEGWRLLRRAGPDWVSRVAHIPAFIRNSWPGLWRDSDLVLPLAGPGVKEVDNLQICFKAKQFFGSSAFSRPASDTI